MRLLLILILINTWKTRAIDYTNAFPQDNIDTDIFEEIPALFGCKRREDKVLKLKSLYGLMIDNEVSMLGIKPSNEEQPLQFMDEGEVSTFLVIKI